MAYPIPEGMFGWTESTPMTWMENPGYGYGGTVGGGGGVRPEVAPAWQGNFPSWLQGGGAPQWQGNFPSWLQGGGMPQWQGNFPSWLQGIAGQTGLNPQMIMALQALLQGGTQGSRPGRKPPGPADTVGVTGAPGAAAAVENKPGAPASSVGVTGAPGRSTPAPGSAGPSFPGRPPRGPAPGGTGPSFPGRPPRGPGLAPLPPGADVYPSGPSSAQSVFEALGSRPGGFFRSRGRR